MMKKLIYLLFIIIFLFSSLSYATEDTDLSGENNEVITNSESNTTNNNSSDETQINIPSYTIEQLMALSKSKQAKVDIIKKNNIEIENYKLNLSEKIGEVAEYINLLRIDLLENNTTITVERMEELKNILQFLQESTTTLNEDVTNVSNEIDSILDLILTKGMKLEQYDQIIENQNTLIMKMKDILIRVEEI